MTSGIATATIGKTSIHCDANGSVADLRRLIAACADAKPSATPPPSATATLSSGVTPAQASAQPALETKHFADSKVKFAIGLPAGFRDEKTPAGGRLIVESAPKMGALPITVTVTPFVTVGSLQDAEKEAKRLDIGGLDTLGEKRALDRPKSFLVATSPRGALKLVKVHVFVSKARPGLHVVCEGTMAGKATLDAICSSLEID